MIDRRRMLTGWLALTLGAWSRVARANSVLRLVVPFPPGGSPDLLARTLATDMGPALQQNIMIDNRPGAGCTLGAGEVARAAPTGSTLLVGQVGNLAVAPSLYPALPYQPTKSFVPVSGLARVPNVLVVRSDSNIGTLADLIAQARAKPNGLTFSSGGNGSAAHIAFEFLKLKAGIAMLHVPYRGTAPSITDLLGGQVDATFTGTPAVLPHVRAGRLRAIAVSSLRRLKALPQVPTVAESGFDGFDADQWYGIVAPARMNVEAVKRINAAIVEALHSPSVVAAFDREGAIPMPSTPAAFGDLIAREIPRWAEVVKASGMTTN